MELELEHRVSDLVGELLGNHRFFLRRAVSGTYRNAEPAGSGRIVELRVDVDGTRPQQRLSGDVYFHFRIWGFDLTIYVESFVVDNPTVGGTDDEMTITGSVSIYGQPGRVGEAIEVHIPRAWIFADAPPACVNWKVDGATTAIYACPKISAYFRTASIEIDRFQGTAFPSQINPSISPSPAGLPASVSVREVFQRSGVDLTVLQDDVLSDTDGPDPGENWSEVELHDLMEARFDSFVDTRQWLMYGVVVPRFGNPNYSPGYYGVMFDWGGYQSGDTFLRQGCAIAEEAIRGREVGTLYETSPKKDRLILQTFIHEIGHTWNLPHSWQRATAPSSASTSFMNYPWGYTGGSTGETAFWTDFAWAFDDVEVRWMRHADRNDIIFGGRDWIGNNLSRLLDPSVASHPSPVQVQLSGPSLVDMSEPVSVVLTVTNGGPSPIALPADLSPEAGTVQVYVERPDGQIVEHRAPAYRLRSPDDVVLVPPGASYSTSIGLSYASTGPEFVVPGQYRIRALLSPEAGVAVPSDAVRVRVAHPQDRAEDELTELVTRREVAQFMYFGGSARRPELADLLNDAAARYEAASPATVVHLRAALGEHAARSMKFVGVRRGVRRVEVRPADLETAVRHFEAAIELGFERRAMDDTTAAGLSIRLADAYVGLGRLDEGRASLERVSKLVSPTVRTSLDEALRSLADQVKGPTKKPRSRRR